jgi:hypothetical protein
LASRAENFVRGRWRQPGEVFIGRPVSPRSQNISARFADRATGKWACPAFDFGRGFKKLKLMYPPEAENILRIESKI